MMNSIHITRLIGILRRHAPETVPREITHETPLRIRFSSAEFDETRLQSELTTSVDGWDVFITHDREDRFYEIAVF